MRLHTLDAVAVAVCGRASVTRTVATLNDVGDGKGQEAQG